MEPELSVFVFVWLTSTARPANDDGVDDDDDRFLQI